MSDTPLLATRRLTKAFGGVSAVDEVNFVIPGGGIVGLIGPNGAGKTTLFNLLSGVIPPTSGDIELAGERITGLRPDQVAARGVARTFQNIQLFGSLSVLDNVLVARSLHSSRGVLAAMLRLPSGVRDQRRQREIARAVLARVGMVYAADSRAADLPYGSQRRVEIARALAAQPRLVLLDEPLAGLARGESGDLTRLFRQLADDGITVLLVEHNVPTVMAVCDRVVVLDHGVVIADGSPAEVNRDPAVQAAYLGVDFDEELAK